MRLPHFLVAPKSRQQPSLCIWFDTETHFRTNRQRQQVHRLKFGWACYQRQGKPGEWSKPEWLRFTTPGQFWDFVEAHVTGSKALYLFAHNGAFDLPVTQAFTELPARGWELKKAVCDAPPIILKWRKGNMSITFIDTLNIWRMSLAQVAIGQGMTKLPMPKQDASVEEWDSYGKNDTDIIRVAVINWLAFLLKHDLGPFAHTLASQALKTFKYRFMTHEIFIDTNDKANALARAAYVGGRTECMQIGSIENDVYYLDVNGMYPDAMRNHDYPTKLRSVYSLPEDDEIEEWRKDYVLIVDCLVNTPSPDYPIIQNKKLLYPTGEFRTVLAHAEFIRAWDRGHIVKCYSAALYDKAPIFKDFIDVLYRLRREAADAGNLTDKHNLKILTNSLYGKFGQRGRRFEECGTTDPNAVWTHTEIDIDSDTVIKYRAFGGIVQAFIDDAEGSESFPAIAACVTSYARIKLLDAFERCGRENIYYCDTDSIMTNAAGFASMTGLISSEILGAWKLEKVAKAVTLHGPKDYVIDGKTVTKGIRASAARIAHNTYEQDKFVGFRGLLQRGKLDAPIVYKVRKKLKRIYTKGKVLRSGRVAPLRLRTTKRDTGRGGGGAPRKR